MNAPTRADVLKPCPFCGGKADTAMCVGEVWNVGCRSIGCIGSTGLLFDSDDFDGMSSVPGYATEEAAVEAWNTRASTMSTTGPYNQTPDEVETWLGYESSSEQECCAVWQCMKCGTGAQRDAHCVDCGQSRYPNDRRTLASEASIIERCAKYLEDNAPRDARRNTTHGVEPRLTKEGEIHFDCAAAIRKLGEGHG